MERCELYKTSNGDYTYYLIVEIDPNLLMVKCSQEPNLRDYPYSIPIPLSNGKILWAESYDDDLKGNSKRLLEDHYEFIEKIDDYYCDFLKKIRWFPYNESEEINEGIRKEISELQNYAKRSYVCDEISERNRSVVKKTFDQLCNFRSSWILSKKRTLKSCGFKRMKDAALHYKKVNLEIVKRVEYKIKNDLVEPPTIVCSPTNPNLFQLPISSWSLENKVEFLINCYYYSIDEVNKLYKTDKVTKEFILEIIHQVRCS